MEPLRIGLALAAALVAGLLLLTVLLRLPPQSGISERSQRPDAVVNGLAVYSIGNGTPLLLFPYPHGSTVTSMVESPLVVMLTALGRRVITFDPPGAYFSTREPDCTLAEMLSSAEEALRHFGVDGPVEVAGHSMGGFCAVAFAVERPERTSALVVACGNPGYPAVRRQWFSENPIHGLDFLEMSWYGARQIMGTGNLATHKKMANLVDRHLFVDKTRFTPVPVNPGDGRRPSPARDRWMDQVRKEDYSARISSIRARTLILSGREDMLSSESVNQEMHRLIPGSKLVFFENSRHYPFIEEEEAFRRALADFLGGRDPGPARGEIGW